MITQTNTSQNNESRIFFSWEVDNKSTLKSFVVGHFFNNVLCSNSDRTENRNVDLITELEQTIMCWLMQEGVAPVVDSEFDFDAYSIDDRPVWRPSANYVVGEIFFDILYNLREILKGRLYVFVFFFN